jgi:hypothetical protein
MEAANICGGAGPSKPAAKTKEQLEEAAGKVQKAARSGIRKQMAVGSPSSSMDA